MKLYFSSNIGGAEDRYEILFIINGVYRCCFSYFYHKNATGVKLYFAGAECKSYTDAIKKAGGKDILYSFFYLLKQHRKKIDEFIDFAKDSEKEIFLDSGGFTAHTRGVEINIQDYIDFIKKNKIKVYANLDVIGDHKKSMVNQSIMERAGLSPLPVFHYGTDYSELELLCKKYNYIALGGLVPITLKKDVLKNHLNKCFAITKNKVKCHGFGMTNKTLLKVYPFYSVDSTSWLGGAMRAEIYKFKKGEMKMISVSNRNHSSTDSMKYNDVGKKRWRERVINNAIESMIPFLNGTTVDFIDSAS